MNKYLRKLSLLFAIIMIITMCVPIFAETIIPNKNDATTVSIIGLEPDVTLMKYQIVDAEYYLSTDSEQGFKQYVWTDLAKNVIPADQPIFDSKGSFSLTQQQLADIAAYVDKNNVQGSELVVNDTAVEVGTWLVLVNGGTKIYNPMIVSVYYGPVNNEGHYVYNKPFNPEDGWSLTTDDIYAKVSDIDFDKSVDNIDVETLNTDNTTVKYTLTSKIPSYSDEYVSPVFMITDTLHNVALDKDSIKVKVNETEIDEYDIDFSKLTSEGIFTITINPEYLLTLADKATQPTVVISYTGTVNPNVGNWTAAENDAVLTYSNEPGTTEDKKDMTATYSFNINGEIIKTDTEDAPLADAIFGLYYDEACENLYQESPATKADGYVLFNGLEGKTGTDESDVQVYYMKELKAPAGFALNDDVYKVEVIPSYTTNNDNAGHKNDLYMDSYEVRVSQKDNGAWSSIGSVVHTFEDGADKQTGTPAGILNTQFSNLPSTGGIGTYIFTIVGVIIMAVSAGLLFIRLRNSCK